VAKAVLWSFLGVRKRKDYDRDSVSISPLQIVIAGIVGGVLFVLAGDAGAAGGRRLRRAAGNG
jgi:hypothetical protein